MVSLTLRNIQKRFGKTEVIRGIDLDVEDGEFVVFVGPSGCGKSTLLRMIAGLEDITSGEFRLKGRVMNEVLPAKRGIAMVFQSYALYPHLNVRDNMAFGLKVRGVEPEERLRRVNAAAATLKLEPLLSRFPRELSGGQRQRVAIGRAIVGEPVVFLFDEPLSNLDAELRVHMRSEIAALHQRLGNTMIYVTHDQIEAMTLADKIVVLREGIVEQVGTPRELYQSPRNLFVAQFIGSPKMNILPLAAVRLPPNSRAPAGAVQVGLRPEHIEIEAAGEGIVGGKIAVTEYTGASTLVHVSLDNGETCLVICEGEAPTIGTEVALATAASHLHFFDAKGEACGP